MFTWLSEYSFSNYLSLKIILFHDLLVILLWGVTVFMAVSILAIFKKKLISTGYLEHHTLEFWWTLIPAFMVLLIFFPSVMVLNTSFSTNSVFEKIVNVVGHQWNWEYEYSLKETNYNFTASPEENPNNRLLDTSGYVFVSSTQKTLFKMTSEDVMHSFALPELGVKVDAMPGRVKEFILSDLVSEVGVFSGQCSEICGVYHSKMPMVVVSLPFMIF